MSDSEKSFRFQPSLIFIGGAMGTADVIPGVSGGTMALILGVSPRLVEAISLVDLNFLRMVIRGEFKRAFAHIHGEFLVQLGFGILFAVFSLAKGVSFLLKNHPTPTWAFFFGLIVASFFLVRRSIQKWGPGEFFGLGLGTFVAAFVALQIPLHGSGNLWWVFLTGMIAISAMILPGISGSFLLVFLGQYEMVLEAVHSLNLGFIAVFGTGCALGLLGFSRVLKVLLARLPTATMATMAGLMLGSLVKIWPFHGPAGGLVLPGSLDGVVMLSIGTAILGLAAPLVLDGVARRRVSP